MNDSEDRKAYIIGGGIAGLAAAVYLITDAGMEGSAITVFDRDSAGGGSFDGRGSAAEGYSCRGYRMFEESVYLTTYDLLSRIPSTADPKKTLKDEFFEFNRKVKIHAKARLVKNGKIIDARKMELSWRDRLALVKMLYFPEKVFRTMTIADHYSPRFFKTNFWFEWSTTYAFQPWHSLVEMKRYLG